MLGGGKNDGKHPAYAKPVHNHQDGASIVPHLQSWSSMVWRHCFLTSRCFMVVRAPCSSAGLLCRSFNGDLQRVHLPRGRLRLRGHPSERGLRISCEVRSSSIARISSSGCLDAPSARQIVFPSCESAGCRVLNIGWPSGLTPLSST